MAECSYARCVQQRRNIRRELQRWTRNMVHIVGLERIAEELMGRRKWKLYQESMSRSYLQPLLNNNVKTRTNQEECFKDQLHHHHPRQQQLQTDEGAEVDERSKDDFASPPPSPTTSIGRGRGGEEDIATAAAIITGTERKENENGKSSPPPLVEDTDDDDQDKLKDWTPPTKCYFCVDGKLDSEHNAHGVLSPRNSDSDSSDSHSDGEVPPSLTASGLLNNHHHHPHQRANPVAPANMPMIESVSSMAALAAVFSGGNGPGGVAAHHLPFYTTSLAQQQNWYLANMARIQGGRLQPPAASDTTDKSSGEQPLDLSKASASSAAAGPLVNNVRLPTLDTKHIFKAKPRMSAVAGRRTYTEDELQAALRDIQSGKLGTRRAAVIYGIPRSTLRNKVYKLALERERESHLNTSTPLKSEEDDAMDEDKELSGAEEEKEVERALDAPLLDILQFSNIELPPEALKALKQRRKEGEPYGPDPYMQNLLLVAQNILNQKAALDSSVLSSDILPELFKSRIIAEDKLKMHLQQQQQQSQSQQHNNGDADAIILTKTTRPSPSNSVNNRNNRSESDMETDESPSNVILKIPSYKPTTTSNKNGCDHFIRGTMDATMVSPPATTSESGSPPILPGKGLSIKDVKDVIAQSISQKFQANLVEAPRRPSLPMEMDFKRGTFTPPSPLTVMQSSVIKTHHQDMTRQYQPPPKPPHHHQNSANQSAAAAAAAAAAQNSGGKGTRPKRGKYRNYDRDSLVEAVRAVQRGEMSVHRAGSYYGVPHSTLEYKVKERHLMRPRKRDPKPNPVDEKIASLKQNDIRNSQEKMKQVGGVVMKPPQKYPPTSPNGMKLPIFEQGIPTLGNFGGPPNPFPFWPHPATFHPMSAMEYARGPAPPFPPSPDFFATQMMQKLQEESRSLAGNNSGPANSPALAKSARQIAESLLDGTGSNGSFLDGIIRSSLESGVPAPEEKSPKDDIKNIAPENMSNKALLDQLCRNSRLTPLTKPAVTTTPEANSSGDESYRKGTSPLNFAPGGSKDDTPDGPDHPETIDLSNDSMESGEKRKEDDRSADKSPLAAPRIYLKKDLANPDNLQPQMLMRFRDFIPDAERNGIGEGITGSASDNDAPQD